MSLKDWNAYNYTKKQNPKLATATTVSSIVATTPATINGAGASTSTSTVVLDTSHYITVIWQDGFNIESHMIQFMAGNQVHAPVSSKKNLDMH